MKNKGFTLVELSIVLVIIGLLIGGILAAQSMISSAKINATIRQLQQFDVAVANFVTKFNGLPGDSTAMGCTTVTSNVCGNRVIENDLLIDENYAMTMSFLGEAANFWPVLQQSGFANPQTFTATVTTAFTVNGSAPNSPAMKIGKNIGVIPIFMHEAAGAGPSAHFYALTNYSNVVPANNTLGTMVRTDIAAKDALALDVKLDDGLPGLDTNRAVFDADGSGVCSNGITYTSAGGIGCWLFIKMGATSAAM